jgi:starch phosphorylase
MPVRASRVLHLEPALPAPLEPLRDLAWNLRWTWDTETVELFKRLGPERWEPLGHNPVRLLQTTPREELERLASDPGMLEQLARVREGLDRYMNRPPRGEVEALHQRGVVAYFSLEFALAECLASYSGGLGVLAGDHLKSASDLGLPFVGVSLLYSQGYFQQALRPDGWQLEEYAENDFWTAPLREVLGEDGSPVMVAVPFPGREVWARIWVIEVGQVRLFILDTNVDQNTPADRAITSRLYGGDLSTRIQQEMVLGIGGVRALQRLGINVAVCHMNEGHSALLGLERIRTIMESTGASFEEARLPVAASSVFTTHTAVAAGIDLFPTELVTGELGPYYRSMGIDDRTLLGLGRINPEDDYEPFSMALLGLRLSTFRNAVSKLHRGVSQRLWKDAWPGVPVEQIPISSVTNGVHLPTWVAPEIATLYDRHLGPQWRDDPSQAGLWQRIPEIPNHDLWTAHSRCRARLLERANAQHREQAIRAGHADAISGRQLDPGILTIGFARRFASYKRATLIFRDPQRLSRIVNNPDRPLQIIFAGKAHPMDDPGKQLIRELVEYSQRPEFRGRVVMLERYDVGLARLMVQGCDLWLNNPLRPLEASGTSGMKAVANGVLHASVMDGWWHEAFQPGLGWAIGGDLVDEDPEVQDAFDAQSIYDLIEQEIAPLYYARDAEGIPWRWTEMMKAAIATYAPAFNTDRMVAEYAAHAYQPAAAAWHELSAEGLRPARELAAWQAHVRAAWHGLKVVGLSDDWADSQEARPVNLRVRIRPGNLDAADIAVHVVAGPAAPDGSLEIVREAPLALEARHGQVLEYAGAIDWPMAGRAGYAVRITPSHPLLLDPLSMGLVLWA